MDMQYVPVLVVGFAISLGLTPVSRQVAMRLGVVDRPNQRKIHSDHKPLMGGLALYASFAFALLLFSPALHMDDVLAILSGAAVLAVIGLMDDHYNLGIRIRLVVMVLAVCVLIGAGIHIRMFHNPLIDYPLTIIWVVAVTNAVNFLDNMDGLAAGLTAIAAAFFLLIGLLEDLALVRILSAALLGSAMGFLTYNFNPASTFMGDMGALPLGFVLAVLGIVVEFGSQPVSVSWLVPVLVLALPIFDINLVIFTRLLEGRSPGEAGKDHTSHRLMSIGLKQRATLLVLYGACVFFGMVGLVISGAPSEVAWRAGITSVVLLAMFYALMMWIRHRYQRTPPVQPPPRSETRETLAEL
jgi:UDP-GlcNAc:undecaprenyl-phosphate/decaprenyl-phosphate GlcNAc-1-phosphate transferase